MADWLLFLGYLGLVIGAVWVESRAADARAREVREQLLAKAALDAVAEPDADERLGPVALALLTGGPYRALEAGAVSLTARGTIVFRPEETNTNGWVRQPSPVLRIEGPVPENPTEVEAGILEAVGSRGLPAGFLHPNALRYMDLDALVLRLVDEGYLYPAVPAASRQHHPWGWAAAALSVPLAGTMVFTGSGWGPVVSALVAGLLGWFASGFGTVITLPYTTGKGDMVIRQARERHERLDPMADQPADYVPDDVGLAVAVFGDRAFLTADSYLMDQMRSTPEPGVMFVDGPGE
ncbi:TIGR04222 domain-containing membrane protein [Streptomyces sp. NPDC047061]|uniref:TIGR04222 domain-containing membrane protein n=1 Tax=Streptomyces sp. NPDC047061 TaxID=3154605 RepID=UPI0033D128FD